MSSTPSAPGNKTGPSPLNEARLESWGEIANYLRRDIRTVQRWERNLGLPIHRLAVGKQSSVFAYPSELDKWFKEQEREKRLEKDELEAAAARNSPPVSVSSESVNNHGERSIPIPSEGEKT